MIEHPNMTSSSEKPEVLEKPTFEAAFEQLQAAVKKLESGELSLEQSLRQFEEGVRLTRICQEHLSAAEQRVEILMKSGNDSPPNLQPFPGSKS
jgi:exodeoxyribonuclease VII small subunit